MSSDWSEGGVMGGRGEVSSEGIARDQSYYPHTKGGGATPETYPESRNLLIRSLDRGDI